MAFRALGTFASGASPLTPGTPAGVVAGDILVAWLEVDTATSTVTPPTGVGTWNLLSHPTQATPDGQSYWLYWRLATGSEPASENWVTSSNLATAAVIGAWSGRASGGPVVSTVAQATTAAANGSAVTANSVTPTANSDLAIFFGADTAFALKDYKGTFSGAGYVDRGSVGVAGYAGLSVSTRDAVSAGATGVISGVLTEGVGGTDTSGWSTLQIYIPAAAAIPDPSGWKKYLLAAGYFAAKVVAGMTGYFTLTWDPATYSAGGAGLGTITGYNILYDTVSRVGGGAYAYSQYIPGAASSAGTVNGLVNGTTYYATVVSTDGTNNSPANFEVSKTV